MKRLLALCLALCLFSTAALAAGKAALPKELNTNVGRSYVFAPAKRGTWLSSDPAVAMVTGQGIINFVGVGQAVITHTDTKGKESTLTVTVAPGGEMPPVIQQGIDFALNEWREAAGQPFPRSNKYTFWLRKAKSTFGWCGAFANYCLDEVGIPMERRNASTLQEDGRPYAAYEAGVPKIWETFTKMDRIAYIPQPGYEVIYGRRGSTPYVHLGLVTAVTDLGEGKYLVETVEGNMDNRILRYSYIYDAMAENKERNYFALPAEQQTQPDVFKYEPHNKGAWYITCFGQTWY